MTPIGSVIVWLALMVCSIILFVCLTLRDRIPRTIWCWFVLVIVSAGMLIRAIIIEPLPWEHL